MNSHLSSRFGRLNIIEMAVLLKLNYRFHTITVKIPTATFEEINKPILKFIWKCKRPRIGKIILKNKVEGDTLPNFKKKKKLHKIYILYRSVK